MIWRWEFIRWRLGLIVQAADELWFETITHSSDYTVQKTMFLQFAMLRNTERIPCPTFTIVFLWLHIRVAFDFSRNTNQEK